jgi:hypothetical protein
VVAIQVRDVPDAVRDALAAEADARGQSLQVFLSEVLEREAKLARNRAWLKRTLNNPIARIAADESSADLIRRQRDERTQHILDAVSGSPE